VNLALSGETKRRWLRVATSLRDYHMFVMLVAF